MLTSYPKTAANSKSTKHNSASGNHAETILEQWVLYGGQEVSLSKRLNYRIENTKLFNTKMKPQSTKNEQATFLNLRGNKISHKDIEIVAGIIKNYHALTTIDLSNFH